MELWIPVTIAAAFAQTLRFMVQKHLKATALSTGGATWARFLYSAPLILILVLIYARATGQALPAPGPRFWGFALTGGLAQILATMCVVALFSHRNFAVGITFKKTEVIQTAIAGFLILGETVSPIGGVAIFIGFCGVLFLSDPPGGTGAWTRRLVNPAAGLGLLSGVFFALSAVGYRGASLSLAGDDVALRAGWTLAMVTLSQTLALGAWLGWRERGQITAVLAAWRIAGLVGLLSMLGSYGWFVAFSLQNAAYVFAVGQIELIFSLFASVLFFREVISRRELLGMGLLTASILAIVIAR